MYERIITPAYVLEANLQLNFKKFSQMELFSDCQARLAGKPEAALISGLHEPESVRG